LGFIRAKGLFNEKSGKRIANIYYLTQKGKIALKNHYDIEITGAEATRTPTVAELQRFFNISKSIQNLSYDLVMNIKQAPGWQVITQLGTQIHYKKRILRQITTANTRGIKDKFLVRCSSRAAIRGMLQFWEKEIGPETWFILYDDEKSFRRITFETAIIEASKILDKYGIVADSVKLVSMVGYPAKTLRRFKKETEANCYVVVETMADLRMLCKYFSEFKDCKYVILDKASIFPSSHPDPWEALVSTISD